MAHYFLPTVCLVFSTACISLLITPSDRPHHCPLHSSKGTPLITKTVFFRPLPKLPLQPPSPQFGQLVPLFFDVKKNDILARITEPSNDDYGNDGSDNCDHVFGTFDDFGVKNDQKVSNNMILMSKYKGKHGGKKGQTIRAGASPPPFSGKARKKTFFFSGGLPISLTLLGQQYSLFCKGCLWQFTPP